MSQAIDALRADRATLLDICDGLAEAEWKAESGCEGWSVQDLVNHMAALYWAAVDASVLPDVTGLPTERAQDAFVEARRSMSPKETLEDYRAVSEQACVALEELGALDMVMDLGDLGSYPMSELPLAYCLDHYLHIRADLFAPRGPWSAPVPAASDDQLGLVLDWVEVALPQQNTATLAELTNPVEVVITGPAARTMSFGPSGPPAATIRSSADACARWVTHRASWNDVGAETSGDEKTLDVFRRVKVF
jgi:uncharacterized protein (TIGR03083 family)